MMRRWSAPTEKGRCLVSSPSSASSISGGSGGTGGQRSGSPAAPAPPAAWPAPRLPIGATAFGSVATAPTKARTTSSGQWLTKRDSSVRPGMKCATNPTIGKSAEQNVWQ